MRLRVVLPAALGRDHQTGGPDSPAGKAGCLDKGEGGVRCRVIAGEGRVGTAWRGTSSWVRWIRLVAAPLALVEVAIERGNYPPGDERWAWALAGAFAAGAVLLAVRPLRLVGVLFDLAAVSGFVVLYGFEPSSPARELFFLTTLEAALLFGLVGALLAPLASTPALAAFEARAADHLEVAFDPGHVLGPAGLQLLVGLVVASLARGRAEELVRDP